MLTEIGGVSTMEPLCFLSMPLCGENSDCSKSLYVVFARCLWLLLTLADKIWTDVSTPLSDVVAFRSSLVKIVMDGFMGLLSCKNGS